MSVLETAIPEGLKRPRTCPMSMKDGWDPPYPSYSARFDSSIEHLGMVIFGVQGPKDQPHLEQIHEICQGFMAQTLDDDDVLYRDQSEFVDSAGAFNRIIVCYFTGGPSAHSAVDRLRQKWLGIGADSGDLGRYVEQLWPSVDRLETLYSSNHLQGVAHLADKLSGEIQEHGYWGSARDRLPAAQTDQLEPAPGNRNDDGPVVEVREIQNLCLIRSGQV